ncbi:hypothetical protein HK100_010720, partial [Physocladia obscura]
MRTNNTRMDPAVLTYFLRRVAEITNPPYDARVVHLLVELVETVSVDSMGSVATRDVIVGMLYLFFEGLEEENGNVHGGGGGGGGGVVVEEA